MKREDISNAVGNISTRHIQEAGNYSTSRKTKGLSWWTKRIAPIAACAAIVFVATIMVPNRNPGSGEPQAGRNPSGYTDVQGEISMQTNNNPETSVPAQTNWLIANKLENAPGKTDMDVQYSSYDNLPYDVWMAVLDDFHELVGMSYEEFTAKLSDTLSLNSFYSLSSRGIKDGELDTEYHLHDYVFDYGTENNGKAIIAICTFEQPLRDYFFKFEDPELSEINGTQLAVYEYKNQYLVQFSYQNVNYDIETTGMELEDLEALLVGLLE